MMSSFGRASFSSSTFFTKGDAVEALSTVCIGSRLHSLRSRLTILALSPLSVPSTEQGTTVASWINSLTSSVLCSAVVIGARLGEAISSNLLVLLHGKVEVELD